MDKAPWWGGFFKRLIRSVKNCLKKVVGNATLTMDELSTLIVQMETVLNPRPLTYIAAEEIEELLTPAHLLLTGRRLIGLPDAETVLEMNEDPDFLVPMDAILRYVTLFWCTMKTTPEHTRGWER